MILTLITFILVLSILVFVHEFGHFIMAKKIGIKVEEFGFGLPPRIWGVKKGETIYSINWLPIGGFVKLAGEDEETEHKSQNSMTKQELKRYFFARSKKERAAVLLAGVTMNFILAVTIVSFIFTQGVSVPTETVHIEKVIANSPASSAGLVEKDIIRQYGDYQIKSNQELIEAAKKYGDQEVSIELERQGKAVILTITARKNPPPNEGPLGIVITNLEERRYPFYLAPFYGLVETTKMSVMMLQALGVMLYKLVTFQPIGADIAGPIGIAQVTGEAVKFGFTAVLQLMGILSLNLAIINILPIPALDGGRLMFVVLEKFIGRRVKPKIELIAHQIGMAILLSLIVLVTINDILRIIRK